MTNNLSSNITEKLARVFLDHFDAARVQSKNVNRQLLSDKFGPSSGEVVYFKRPHDFLTEESADGNVSLTDPSDLISGKIPGRVQNYITVRVRYDEIEEALHLDQLDQIMSRIGPRIAIDLDLKFTNFMLKNSALYSGVLGNAVETWDEVAEAASVLRSHGAPGDDKWYFGANPYTMTKLASNQRSLGAGGSAGSLVKTAHDKAMIAEGFAGLNVMSSTTLASVATQAGADRVGALAANPDATYLTHKDTYTQSLSVSGFQANLEIKAGERITITGRYMLNQATRQPIYNEAGNKITYSAVVAADVTLSGTGTGTITINGPAIYEATGQYNTVDSAPIAGDVVTLLGNASTSYQPNLFWCYNAFSIGSVPIKPLHGWENTISKHDNMQFRVVRYSDADANKQMVRFDFHPAFAALNPYQAGHAWGRA